ncbi:MAG: hypothetical protein AAB891_00845 [Patescibacteria group bacterium]
MQNHQSKINVPAVTGFIILIFAVSIFIFRWENAGTPKAAALDSFAQCLADKGAVMYGANWCPHCQNEKSAFGPSFRIVPYVECPTEPARCLSAGIESYPTWIFPDGKKLVGEQGFPKLSQESGCVLPLSK